MRKPHSASNATVRFYSRFLMAFIVLPCIVSQNALSQEIWEYSPYRVRVWLSVSPTLALSEDSEREIHRQIAEFAEINFGATWTIQVQSTPDALFGSVLNRLDELTVDQLLSRELVLVVGKSDEAKQAYLKMNPPPPKPAEDPAKPAKKLTKADQEVQADLAARAASLQSVRTLDGAIEKMKRISIQPLQYSALQRDIIPFLGSKQWSNFKAKIQPFEGSNVELLKQLESGETLCALIQKMDLEKFKKVARQIPARLPWQPEALLRDNDKVFLVSVDKVGESIQIQVKELDSFVRRMGEIASTQVIHKHEISRAVASLAKLAFSPMVRIEETDFKTAVLRVRAAGLLTKEEHPIRVLPGDLILPIIRRDDANGNPTALQSIPFTYVAVTEKIDNVSRLYGAIFTASRGSLSIAKNRRTQRIGLKVNASYPDTNLKLGIQQLPGSSFVGAEIYRRTPGSDDLQMVGRTDWRGILPIGTKELPTIQYDPPGESKTTAIAIARQLAREPVAPPEYKLVDVAVGGPSASSQNTAALSSVKDSKTRSDKTNDGKTNDGIANDAEKGSAPAEVPATPKKKKGSIQLGLPLYLYYVKNGETLLARLPIVNGVRSLETADMPDDRRRLETEAFLKGLQGEILDLVIRRKVLESRIRQEIRKKDTVKAEKLLDELKRAKSFEKMSEQVEALQRRALSNEQGKILFGISKKIDGMLDTTRTLMQKYLQDSLVRTLENELSSAK